MSKEPTQKNTLPRPLRGLSAQELFLLTGIPIDRIQGFIEGKFKPSKSDHKKIANAAVPFYAFNQLESAQFILRKKYRLVKHYLTKEEKEDFLYDSEDYGKRINALVEKYWSKIERVIAAER